ncbi:MAG: 5'/3'-nucleotidase SurE [Geminicoccaceae bacterium]|nr:5'/3'-nucleotidase SurE [Geminicoccaceae bacterium]MCX8101675.1 5'/3'-nucleotidase SurE [Geminicoccaceae bacterium]MDW8371741.1 5'/3'-nucleotidase SurE [Geminicoccaceae bacterium]
MRILVTNDDGIQAHGIKTLEHIARTLSDDVWVVAPETNQSGAGHSLTLRRPLRWRKLSERHIAVDGTPTDAVLLALQKLIPPPRPRLVLSGVNHGANLAEDVTYSGTIAAAMEAVLLGVPAIALSQVARDRHKIKWATTERHAGDLLRRLAAETWPEDTLINVNFPDVPAHKVKGVKITRQGKKKLGDQLVERVDPRGEPYVWIGLLKETRPPEPGTDLAAVADGWVSVTPIHLDMTHRAIFRQLANALGLAEPVHPS